MLVPNSISEVNDVGVVIYWTEDAAPGTVFSYQILYDAAIDSTPCPITAKLFIEDPDTHAWVEYNPALDYHNPITTSSFKSTNTAGDNADAGYFEFRIDEADKATYKGMTQWGQWDTSFHTYRFNVTVTDL